MISRTLTHGSRGEPWSASRVALMKHVRVRAFFVQTLPWVGVVIEALL